MENSLCKQYSTVEGGIPCSISIVCLILFVYISTCFYSFVFSSSVTGTKLHIRLKNQKSPNCMVTIKIPSKTSREYKLNTSLFLHYLYEKYHLTKLYVMSESFQITGGWKTTSPCITGSSTQVSIVLQNDGYPADQTIRYCIFVYSWFVRTID